MATPVRSIIADMLGDPELLGNYYVDSNSGSDTNNGRTPLFAFATITKALTVAVAGDRIIVAPGGSETVTATLAVAVARLEIICDTRGNSAAGFTVTGAGTLALMTVSAAAVRVEGLNFVHTGTTGSAAGILTTNAADKLTVKGCRFDDSAIVTTFTGIGVDVVNACDDVVIEGCRFLDQKWGVKFTVATGVVCARPKIIDCEFFVGKSASFGIASVLTGTGIVQGLVVARCRFIEATGAGAVATAAWDGTNGANAAVGPLKFEAAVDQFLVHDCVAYAVGNFSFANLANNAGAGDFVNNATSSAVAGDLTSVYSDTTAVHSDTTAIHLQTTAIDSDITIIKSDTTAIHLQTTTVASDLVLMQTGYPVAKIGINADIAGIPNNSQAAGGLLATATGGHVIIDEIIISKDVTALTGPTNIRLSTDNVYGDTGAADPVAAIAVASVTAATRIAALGTVVWTTLKLPFVLESGKKLYIDGDNSAGTSAGNYLYAIRGRAQNASTTLI